MRGAPFARTSGRSPRPGGHPTESRAAIASGGACPSRLAERLGAGPGARVDPAFEEAALHRAPGERGGRPEVTPRRVRVTAPQLHLAERSGVERVHGEALAVR